MRKEKCDCLRGTEKPREPVVGPEKEKRAFREAVSSLIRKGIALKQWNWVWKEGRRFQKKGDHLATQRTGKSGSTIEA